jgi:hypothetical protein
MVFGFPTPPAPESALAVSTRKYRNPLVVAEDWQRTLGERRCSAAELARALGVSRARVSQVLRLLTLSPPVKDALHALGDPWPGRVVTERALRRLLDLPAGEPYAQLSGPKRI